MDVFTFVEDLLQGLGTISRRDCLIESTGISTPVAETFTFVDEKGKSLSDVAN